MAIFGLISSVIKSIFNIGEVIVEEAIAEEVVEGNGFGQESKSLSGVHIPPSQDEESESDEEWESGEEEFGILGEYVEDLEVINKGCDYKSGKEYLEEPYRMLITLQRYSTSLIAQSMMGTARFMVPTLPPVLESSGSDSESVDDYSDVDDSDSWSVIDER